jgi:hypothetical protein
MQSIKEQHQIPDDHNSHHPRYGEHQGLPRLSSSLSALIAFTLTIQRHHERKDLVG